MKDISKYCISADCTIREALTQLNKLSGDSLVLLAVNEEGVLLGTLTDGDVRRGLVSGCELSDKVETFMHKDFKYLKAGVDMVVQLRELRKRQISFVPVLDEKMHLVDVVDMRHTRSRLPIDAVLMAGGKGERLRPLTEKTPKPLLPVGGKAIIDHNVERLISFGVEHISVTVNYLKEQLEAHFAEPIKDVQVQTVPEPKFLGTIGSIRFVGQFYNDTVLVMNSDLFTNIDYEEFYLHFRENEADMSVAAIPYNVSIPYGILDLDGRDIKGLLEKPCYNYYANAGIYLIKRSALDEIPEDEFFNATDLIEKLIAQNKRVIRFPLNGTWIDIGNPQEYQKANDLYKHLHE